jgi:hypothetical protein
MKKYVFTLVAALLALSSTAQDATAIINKLTLKMNKVKDYSADAVITSDIPMVKILPSKAVVYYKQKDKFKIDAKGIAIVPKQGISDVTKLLADPKSYNPIYMGKEKLGNVLTELVSLFPANDTADLILAKLWIDPVNDIVLKSQVTTRSSGMVTAAYTYGNQMKWGLPDKMVFTVDVKKFKIPKGVATDINRNTAKDGGKDTKKTGEIKVDLTNYKVNIGLKDDFFKEKK